MKHSWRAYPVSNSSKASVLHSSGLLMQDDTSCMIDDNLVPDSSVQLSRWLVVVTHAFLLNDSAQFSQLDSNTNTTREHVTEDLQNIRQVKL